MFESRKGLLDLVGEGLPFLGWKRAAMAADEKQEAEVGLKLRNGSAHVRLPNAERGCGSRHSTMPHDGSEQVEMSRVHHA